MVDSHTPPAGDLAHNPGMCADMELNQRPFESLAGAQSTEPHQPGLLLTFLICLYPDETVTITYCWLFGARLCAEHRVSVPSCNRPSRSVAAD